MKRQLFLSMFALLSVATFAQTPATTNINKSGFPKIMPDNSIEFSIKAPEAQKVQLDFGRKYDMTKNSKWSLDCNYRTTRLRNSLL